jgi:3-oxoacyl-[acyl-carrier-protein] synthase III
VIPTGIQAIGSYLPRGLRTNAFWPDVSAARTSAPLPVRPERPGREFQSEMRPYLDDRFFGAVERRAATDQEPSVVMGLAAARSALAAARLRPSDIDCLIAVSMFPDRVGSGDAAFLARELGHGGGAFNLEATCAGSVSALLVACGLVGAGLRSRVLVVAAALMTRAIGVDDVNSRVVGDAAAAFVVGAVPPGSGILGAHTIHTGDTCGTWLLDAVPRSETTNGDIEHGQKIRLRLDPSITHVLASSAAPALRGAALAAVKAADVSLDDIAFFVFNNATAWHAKASARVLGVDPAKTLNTFPRYGNIGPALMPVIAHTAALEGRVKPGDLVLLYGFGGQAEAVAVVLRWGDVALGPPPDPPTEIDRVPTEGQEAR